MNSAAMLNCGSSQTSDLAFLRDASKRGLLVHSSSEGLLTDRLRSSSSNSGVAQTFFTAQKAGDCYEPKIDVPTIGRRDGVRCSGICRGHLDSGCRGHLESGGDQCVADDAEGETDDETLHGSTEG